MMDSHKRRCSSVVQPGEYVIDNWDYKRCTETNPGNLTRCEGCNAWFCLSFHWRYHLDSVPIDHFEAAT